jgi:hypothetical protein
MVGEQPVTDSEATETEWADACRPASSVGVFASGEWVLTGTGTTAVGNVHERRIV